MKLELLGDIHKICISGKIFTFHKGTKDISEHLFEKGNHSNFIPSLFIQF